jgi:6-phospho-3-hexuloisomerase
MQTLNQLANAALEDVRGVFARVPDDSADGLIEALRSARRIVVFGLGREGLQMRGLAMRLFHMGLNVSVWADMTTPPVGPGDLLFVSAGPGFLATAKTLLEIARAAGAKTALITAQSYAELAPLCDVVAIVPAQTMADDRGDKVSILPMGSLFEVAQMLFFELVVLKLRPLISETAETMRARHTNLE